MTQRITILRIIGFFLLAALAGPATPVHAGDWYRWRGPDQDGASAETGLPSTWSPSGENLLWKAPVGGMSSPVVMNGKLYTFSRVGEVHVGQNAETDNLVAGPETQEALTCVDANTGKILWQHLERMTQTDVPFWRLGWANPAGDPATGRIYGLGAQCTLVCLDGNDGKLIWRRQMTEEFGMISTFGGRTPSPAVDGDQLFLDGVAFGWGDNARAQHRLFAFNKNTGELNWTNGTGGIPTDAPQNTPVFTDIDQTRVVMFGAGDGNVSCFQANTGKRLWNFRASKRGLNASLVLDGNRFFVCSSEDNLDTNVMGRVACVEFSDHDAREIWRIDGIEAGFPSPTMHGDRLYVLDNKGICYAIDKKLGKVIWEKHCGTIGKGSLVWADGKLIVPEANGRIWMLEDEGTRAKTLSKVELMEKKGREYVIYGTPAVANGRIYLQAADGLYCIGNKDYHAKPNPIHEEDAVNVRPGTLAQIVVTPADAVLHPGQQQKFVAWGFDAKGRPLGEVKAEWSIGQLTPPAPPTTNPLIKPAPQPVESPHADNFAKPEQLLPLATAGDHKEIMVVVPSLGEKDISPAPAAPPAPGAPHKIGNLQGTVDPGGLYTAAPGPFQGGGVFAKVGDVVGNTRVRVIPPLPWKIDFKNSPVGVPPLTWTGAGGKFAVREIQEEGKPRKVLVKLTNVPLYDRARTNFGTPDMSNYTLQADTMAADFTIPPPADAGPEVKATHQLPDMGIIDSRYVLILGGDDQTLQIDVWPQAKQFSANTNKTIPFAWQAHKWYRMKLKVTQKEKTALVQGKVWPADATEPPKWTIELEDDLPIRGGNPGLFAFSFREIETYYDNILVTENQP